MRKMTRMYRMLIIAPPMCAPSLIMSHIQPNDNWTHQCESHETPMGTFEVNYKFAQNRKVHLE